MTAQRPPIVLIHGAFVGPWSFDQFRVPFQAAGYKVHAPALRHHDQGKKPPRELATTSLLDYVKDLEAFIATLPAPPILVGHSLGGLLAQMLAARGRASALVLLAPCAPWGMFPTTLFEIASAQTMLLHGPLWNQIIRSDYDIAAAHSLDRLPVLERKRLYAQFVPESGLATFEMMHWGWDAKRASEVSAAAVKCPVLCLVGEHDKINPPATVRRIADRYRGSYRDLPGHSHWLIGEPGWEHVAALSLTWLAEILAEPKAAKAKR